MYGLTILGNNSAIPAYDRHPTAQALYWNDEVFLIDCGEGTQMQLTQYKIRRGKINHIFISHLHGDHYFGLIGLITSFGLLGREQPLHIYAPDGLEQIIRLQLQVADTTLPFDLHIHTIETADTLLSNKHVRVDCFPVKHRIPCFGFRFTEQKAPRTLLKEKAVAAGIPQYFYNRLKLGEDYINKNGEVILNETVTTAAPAPLSYAYCADTVYLPEICVHLQQVTLMYHEATFLQDLEERAAARFHSTSKQAAMMAQHCQPQRLLIGHFSSKYEDLQEFETEARAVFPKTDLAIEGVTYLLRRSTEAGS